MSLSPWADRLNEKYFGDAIHPYAIFERLVKRHLTSDKTLLDAGCGHGAPVLRKFVGVAKELIGVDLVDFDRSIPGVTLLKRDLTDTRLRDGSVDVVMRPRRSSFRAIRTSRPLFLKIDCGSPTTATHGRQKPRFPTTYTIPARRVDNNRVPWPRG